MSNNKQETSCFNAGHWNGFRQKTGEDNNVPMLIIHLNECLYLKGQNLIVDQYSIINIGIYDPIVLECCSMLATRPLSRIENTYLNDCIRCGGQSQQIKEKYTSQ